MKPAYVDIIYVYALVSLVLFSTHLNEPATLYHRPVEQITHCSPTTKPWKCLFKRSFFFVIHLKQPYPCMKVDSKPIFRLKVDCATN